MGPNASAEAEWTEQKHRRKAKRKELLKAGAISQKMPKVMAESLTLQSLQLDYAALPIEERQRLEQLKADAKHQWLHADSLAFEFWEATEQYLGLESLTLRDTKTNAGKSLHRHTSVGRLCIYTASLVHLRLV